MPNYIADQLFRQLSDAIVRIQTRIDNLEEMVATEHMKIRSRSNLSLGMMPHGELVSRELQRESIIKDAMCMKKIGELTGKIVTAEKLKANMQVSKVRTGLLIIFRDDPELLKNEDIVEVIANVK